MAAISGHDGMFKVGETATVVTYIDAWNLTINQGTAETNQLGKKAKEFIGTTTDWSGSASGSFDTAGVQQASLESALKNGGTVKVALGISADLAYTGDVIITSVAIGVSHGDKVTFSVNFQGTGDLSIPARA